MIIHLENYKDHAPGAKAGNLFRLLENGYPVPAFFCVDECFREEEVMEDLERYFPGTTLFSVRSSASAEDGTEYSFAGQFCTFLRVKREEIVPCIRKVLKGAGTDEVREYCRLHHMEGKKIRMHVIVQEMVEAAAILRSVHNSKHDPSGCNNRQLYPSGPPPPDLRSLLPQRSRTHSEFPAG